MVQRAAAAQPLVEGRGRCYLGIMSLAVVHHPAFSAPMPRSHRFPMGKFARLMRVLLEDGVVSPEMVHVPEPAPRRWLDLAHDPGYVDDILTQTLDPAAERRIGLPISPDVARRWAGLQ